MAHHSHSFWENDAQINHQQGKNKKSYFFVAHSASAGQAIFYQIAVFCDYVTYLTNSKLPIFRTEQKLHTHFNTTSGC